MNIYRAAYVMRAPAVWGAGLTIVMRTLKRRNESCDGQGNRHSQAPMTGCPSLRSFQFRSCIFLHRGSSVNENLMPQKFLSTDFTQAGEMDVQLLLFAISTRDVVQIC